MKLYVVMTDNGDHAGDTAIFTDKNKADAKYEAEELDTYTTHKWLLEINEGEGFGFSTASGGDAFYGADILKEESNEESDESVKHVISTSMKHLKPLKLNEDHS